jgi:hypothetical protein
LKREEEPPCDCARRFSDVMRGAPRKASRLIKIRCLGCGKEFWANTERTHCFNCEPRPDARAGREGR